MLVHRMEPPKGSRESILIIANQNDAKPLMELLRKSNYNPMFALSGQIALELLESHSFRAVLSFETCVRSQTSASDAAMEIKSGKKIPAMLFVQDVASHTANGFDCVQPLSFCPKQFLCALRNMLDSRGVQNAAPITLAHEQNAPLQEGGFEILVASLSDGPCCRQILSLLKQQGYEAKASFGQLHAEQLSACPQMRLIITTTASANHHLHSKMEEIAKKKRIPLIACDRLLRPIAIPNEELGQLLAKVKNAIGSRDARSAQGRVCVRMPLPRTN